MQDKSFILSLCPFSDEWHGTSVAFTGSCRLYIIAVVQYTNFLLRSRISHPSMDLGSNRLGSESSYMACLWLVHSWVLLWIYDKFSQISFLMSSYLCCNFAFDYIRHWWSALRVCGFHTHRDYQSWVENIWDINYMCMDLFPGQYNIMTIYRAFTVF